MILANLTRAIREQNYYAVVLEFLIVIAGVVIGFQITAWNQDREQAELRAVTLERLYADFEEIIDYTDNSITSIEASLVALRTIRRALDEGVLPDEAREQFEFGLHRGYTHREPAQRSSTFSEVEASGRLALLENEELLRALFRYDQNVEAARDTFMHARLIKTEYMRDFTRHYTTRPGEERQAGADFDFETMVADLDFIDAVEQITAMQDVYLTWHTGHRARAQNVLDRLGTELSQ